jgi:hypothetical protein
MGDRRIVSRHWIPTMIVVLLAMPLWASEEGSSGRSVSAEEARLQPLLARLEGKITDAGFLEIRGDFGTAVTHGVRIYSEPSHTLLILGIDSRYAASSAGRAWLQSQGRAEAAFDSLLSEARPLMTIRRPPAGDDRLAVWVHTGGENETLVSDVKLSTWDAFSFESRGSLTEDE